MNWVFFTHVPLEKYTNMNIRFFFYFSKMFMHVNMPFCIHLLVITISERIKYLWPRQIYFRVSLLDVAFWLSCFAFTRIYMRKIVLFILNKGRLSISHYMDRVLSWNCTWFIIACIIFVYGFQWWWIVQDVDRLSIEHLLFLFICGEGYLLFKLSPERIIIGYTCIAYKVEYSMQ